MYFLFVRDSTVPTLQIEIPNTVTAIKAHAFCNWNGRYITIPKSVTSIGWGAFHGCIQLIQLEGGVCYLDKWALGFFDESVTKITLRDDTVGIADQAFCDFSDLASISIPFGVTSIGDYAFCDCDNLTSITIPSSVTSIGDEAFSLCDSLTSVTFENTAGWCASQDENATSGMSISATDLADPATAATYLTDTYYNYYWKRT